MMVKISQLNIKVKDAANFVYQERESVKLN